MVTLGLSWGGMALSSSMRPRRSYRQARVTPIFSCVLSETTRIAFPTDCVCNTNHTHPTRMTTTPQCHARSCISRNKLASAVPTLSAMKPTPWLNVSAIIILTHVNPISFVVVYCTSTVVCIRSCVVTILVFIRAIVIRIFYTPLFSWRVTGGCCCSLFSFCDCCFRINKNSM